MNSGIEKFHDFVINELLAELGDRLNSRKMFGGYGLYLDGQIFGVVLSDGELCFKVGEQNRHDFEKLRAKPWVYTGHKTKMPTAMPYYHLPEEVLADPNMACEWAEKAANHTK